MGGRFSQLHYRKQDTAVHPTLNPFTDKWTTDAVLQCSRRLRRSSASMLISARDFTRLLQMDPKNPVHAAMTRHWFSLLLTGTASANPAQPVYARSDQYRKMMGLDFLTGLALCLRKSGEGVDGVAVRAGICFDLLDFQGSGE